MPAVDFSAALTSSGKISANVNHSAPVSNKSKGLLHIFTKYISTNDGASAFLELGSYATQWPAFFLRKFTPTTLTNLSNTLMDGKNVLSGVAIPKSGQEFFRSLDAVTRDSSLKNLGNAVENAASLGNNICDVGSLLDSRKVVAAPFGVYDKVGSACTAIGGTIGTARQVRILSQLNILRPISTSETHAVRYHGLRLFEKASYLALGFLGLSNWVLRTTYSSWTITAAATSGVVFKILGDFYPKL